MSGSPEGRSRKVIAFDSWTEGSMNIEPLVEAFAQRGLDLFLIHIGSWGHDLGRPKEERIGRLLVRDITYYGHSSFREILEIERPAAVLFLSLQAFAHRAFNRYCVQIGIPTLHLYHGLINVQSVTARRLNPLNVRSQLALAAGRLGKNLSRLWPVYAKALLDTRASLRDWLWFAHDVWRQVSGRSYSGRAAPDTSTTACCLYTEADVSHAVERYGAQANTVFAVGNPDLPRFGFHREDLGACSHAERGATKNIVYIDTALIEVGAVFDGADDFVRHLMTTRDELAAQGFNVIVKLHPAHFRTGVRTKLENGGVELCSNEDFIPSLKKCSAAIVEPSSAAILPALLGLPVLLARYGKLREQEYGKVLTSYPRARVLDSLDGVSAMVKEVVGGYASDGIHNWLKINAGPMPAEEMPNRVAAVIANMA